MNNTYTRNLLLMIIVASIIIFSCRKNDIQIIIPDNSNPDLVTKVTTTISGFVTNENDEAMSGAIVRVGSAFLNTDQFGYFEIKNVEVNETAATFNVSKNGYFKLRYLLVGTATRAGTSFVSCIIYFLESSSFLDMLYIIYITSFYFVLFNHLFIIAYCLFSYIYFAKYLYIYYI